MQLPGRRADLTGPAGSCAYGSPAGNCSRRLSGLNRASYGFAHHDTEPYPECPPGHADFSQCQLPLGR
jgi:hypothetical protein